MSLQQYPRRCLKTRKYQLYLSLRQHHHTINLHPKGIPLKWQCHRGHILKLRIPGLVPLVTLPP